MTAVSKIHHDDKERANGRDPIRREALDLAMANCGSGKDAKDYIAHAEVFYHWLAAR